MGQEDSRFYIETPEGWADQSVYAFNGPEEDGTPHLVLMNIDRELQHDDIAAYAREKTQPIVDNLQGVEVLKDEDITSEGGNPAWEFVYKWLPSEGSVFVQRYVFVFKDEMGYAITGRFTKRTFKTVGRSMTDLIESLLPGTFHDTDEE